MATPIGLTGFSIEPSRARLGPLAELRGGRVLPLGQAVDPVVEQQDVDVDVAAQGVEEVVAADGQAVAVAGDHPHLQLGPRALQSGGQGRGAAVDRVDAVGVHVVREAARAADAGDEDDVLPGDAQLRAASSGPGPGWRSRRNPGTSGRPGPEAKSLRVQLAGSAASLMTAPPRSSLRPRRCVKGRPLSLVNGDRVDQVPARGSAAPAGRG